MAQEYIAVALGTPRDRVEVDLVIDAVGDVDVEARLSQIARTKDEAAALEQQARAETVALARSLAAEHVPVRDIGAMLKVSFQRAHQLLHDGEHTKRAS
ncbi:hypothetical protein [Herbiconiux daphne]|uniref:Uncharacterized protein n=1 Tax=Herbiconiux daphne TaxID=2970914 RepID=A0ABT2H1B7_9MICO|nr:hypothetical protein [Herbiconiux daphne]MCS5733739.1 hypothetical protein [Herbiconiux daphne]